MACLTSVWFFVISRCCPLSFINRLPSLNGSSNPHSTHFQVLSLKLYKSEESSSSSQVEESSRKEEVKPSAKSCENSGAAAAASATPNTDETGSSAEQEVADRRDPFEGLDDITKTCFEVC